MPNANLYDGKGKSTGTVELPEAIFGQEVKGHLIWEAVRNYQANQRAGTAHTKDRSDVTGSTAKLFRQKGTGRARAGSAKSPTRYGGGTTFGPKTRDHSYAMPRKARRAALLSALSDRAGAGDVLVVDGFTPDTPRTKDFKTLIAGMGLSEGREKILLVLDEYDLDICKSARNLRNLDFIVGRELNAYQVMWADKVVLTAPALEQVKEVFGA
ncbi:MAG: 50S ribosomal protein L4 [Candidatus Latescibacteria bacterium]|nr:50S ribosomal protein L4 [bacterium]MCB9512939.1 50S ribosomal protein L4 [Candidatus Latescibacterota bacterium]MCB9516400.1 50S ribosomal protein L4 [Candidatus Latescibacterota bacterium]